jgi:hypothetical protein
MSFLVGLPERDHYGPFARFKSSERLAMSMCDKAEPFVNSCLLSIPFLATLRMFPAGGQYEAAAWCYEDCLQAGRCENALNINYSPGKKRVIGEVLIHHPPHPQEKGSTLPTDQNSWHRCIRDIRTIPKSSTKASEANIRQHPRGSCHAMPL